jgi:undecaprenyl diphosphate synthase
VYAFSAENWSRPALEVDALLALMERTLAAEVAELAACGVRLRFIGELGMLPRSLQRQMRR